MTPACVRLLGDKKILLDKLQDITRLNNMYNPVHLNGKVSIHQSIYTSVIIFNRCKEPSLVSVMIHMCLNHF